jgi:beta-barrel assembly-enhancing protease
MTSKIIKDGIIIIIAFIAVWFFISYNTKPISIKETFIPADTKEKIGEWINTQVTKTFKVAEHNKWEDAIEEVVNLLSKSKKVKNEAYEVIVLENSQLNAFATLGTKLYVFTGLLESIENHQEIAAILAHEMGHVELNHIEQKLLTEFGLVVLTGILTGGEVALSTQIMKDITSGVFSRSKENEADKFALELMEDRGIDPVFMGLVFKKLKDSQELSTDLNFEILSTHPDISKRIKKSFEYEKKSSFKEVKFKTKWPSNEENEANEE